MNIYFCLNCYKELMQKGNTVFCVNPKCFRYGLVTERLIRREDVKEMDLEAFQPKLEIDYMKYFYKVDDSK